MRFLATMIIGDTSFTIPFENADPNGFSDVRQVAQRVAGNLGAELYKLDPVDEVKPEGYQLTAEDKAFINIYLELEKSSDSAYDRGVESSYMQDQIEIWHNDKPQATQSEFHTLYSLWSKALTLGVKPAEVIVHVDNGVLHAVYSDSDKVKCTAVQTDSDDVVQEVQAADAILTRAGKMWSIF